MLLGSGWLHRVMRRTGVRSPRSLGHILSSPPPPYPNMPPEVLGGVWAILDMAWAPGWPVPWGAVTVFPIPRWSGLGWWMPFARKSSCVHFPFWDCLFLRGWRRYGSWHSRTPRFPVRSTLLAHTICFSFLSNLTQKNIIRIVTTLKI
jgi:hypothetical protein